LVVAETIEVVSVVDRDIGGVALSAALVVAGVMTIAGRWVVVICGAKS
jgi:hypothetical protein